MPIYVSFEDGNEPTYSGVDGCVLVDVPDTVIKDDNNPVTHHADKPNGDRSIRFYHGLGGWL